MKKKLLVSELKEYTDNKHVELQVLRDNAKQWQKEVEEVEEVEEVKEVKKKNNQLVKENASLRGKLMNNPLLTRNSEQSRI